MSKLKVHGNVHQSKTFTENVMMNKTRRRKGEEKQRKPSQEKAISLKSHLMSCETEMLIKKLSTTYLANG